MTDDLLTTIAVCGWLTLALTLAAAWLLRRVRAWRRLRENRATIARAKADADGIEAANEMRGRE